MNDQEFFKSFNFNELSFNRSHHRDNSAGVTLHYIGCMIEGKGLLISDREKIEVFPGEPFYIPKGCKYNSYWTGDGTVRFHSFGFTHFPKSQNKSYRLQKLSLDCKAQSIFDTLTQSHTVSTQSIGLLYTFLGILEPTMLLDLVDRQSEMIERAMQYMYKKPTASISEIARECFISESTLYSNFKKICGKTPNSIRQQIRCEKAIDLLTTTNLSVEEISESLLFSSSSYFRKILFSVCQKTPRQIRKETRTI